MSARLSVCLLAGDGLWLHLNNAFRLLLWWGERASEVTNQRTQTPRLDGKERCVFHSDESQEEGRGEVMDERVTRVEFEALTRGRGDDKDFVSVPSRALESPLGGDDAVIRLCMNLGRKKCAERH